MIMLLAAIILNTSPSAIDQRKELRLQERWKQEEKWRWEQQNYYNWKNSIRRN
jgi:hypothetical protein